MARAAEEEEIDRAIGRVRSGDREAFRIVIAACERPLRLLVAAILPQVSAVDDVVQKTLVIAFFRLGDYQTGTSFMAWVATIARYQALNERRRWLAERSFKERLRAEHRLDRELYQGDDAGAFGHQPLQERLDACIAGLGGQAAELVKAHYLEQVRIEDLAQRHGRTSDWVHLVLHRARKALRTCLLAKLRMDGHGS
jgi:RNA polymerase sigma-70 factor (ECF subfamily)